MNFKLVYNKKSDNPNYYIQYGVRVGNKVNTHTIAKLGKHSEILKFHPDPLVYAKEKLEEYKKTYSTNIMTVTEDIDFNKLLPTNEHAISSKSKVLNAGYLYLQYIYKQLNIDLFFDEIMKNNKSTFDINEINRFLTFARILDPKSKMGTFDNLETYLEQPDFKYHQIFRAMDILAENYDSYIEHLFTHSNNIIKRNTSVCYYDCTNYYFEIESADPDYVDPVSGELVKGFRRYGINKQHQPLPQVQMGLFMDGDGIPITMCLTNGSQNEQTTAIPLEQKMTKMFQNKRFIYCADAGLGSANIRLINSMGEKSFIVTQSIKMISDELKKIVFTDDYHLLSSGKPISIQTMKTYNRDLEENKFLEDDLAFKIFSADKLEDLGLYELKKLKNGKSKKVKSKATLKQVIIVVFSRKSMEYQRQIRNKQIGRLKEMLSKNKVESIKKGPNDVTRFAKNTGSSTYVLDLEKIAEEEKYDGYYAVATNIERDEEESLQDFAREIIKINSRRYQIEDCFRVLKTNFEARPVHHHLEERIKAHFLICFTALLIYKLLEVKLKESGNNFSINKIIETLRNISVENHGDIYLETKHYSSKILIELEKICKLNLNKENINYVEFKKIIKKLI